MSETRGFYDFCINITDDENDAKLLQLLNKLYERGYNTVALNQTIDETILENDKKKKKNPEAGKVLNKIVRVLDETDKLKKKFNDKPMILDRLTIIFSDPQKIHFLNQFDHIVKRFHLLAVIPQGNNAMQHACANAIADIITINSKCSTFRMNRKMYMQAVDKETYFEIQYADLIARETRKNTLQNAHSFYVYGKSKNVFISSGAKDYRYIRSPYDIMNLAIILGLSETQAWSCVSHQCKHLLARAECRRYGKGIFTIEHVNNDKDSDEESD